MRVLRSLAVAALALAVAPAAGAQVPQVSGTDLPRLGMGVSLRADATGWAFQVPILFGQPGTGRAFRLEPYFDISRKTTGDSPGEVKNNSFLLGATASYVFNVFPYAFAQVGGGVALNFRSYQAGAAPSDSGTGTSIYALAGGECFLHPRMSLGLIGTLGVESTPKLVSGATTVAKTSDLMASGFLTARFYFQ